MEANMDDTSQKIIDATMALIRDKGYVATTTKDIDVYKRQDALLSVLRLQFTKFLESFKKIRLYFPRPQWYSITVYT